MHHLSLFSFAHSLIMFCPCRSLSSCSFSMNQRNIFSIYKPNTHLLFMRGSKGKGQQQTEVQKNKNRHINLRRPYPMSARVIDLQTWDKGEIDTLVNQEGKLGAPHKAGRFYPIWMDFELSTNIGRYDRKYFNLIGAFMTALSKFTKIIPERLFFSYF